MLAIRLSGLVLVACLFCAAARAGVVYERTNISEPWNYVPFGNDGTPGRPVPGDRIGNQVTLAGADRYLNLATIYFGYGSSLGTVSTYPDTYTAELYRNDGPGGAPGTKLAASTVNADSLGEPRAVTFPFSLLVPDTFTVVVSSSHPTNAYYTSTGVVGPQSVRATPAFGSAVNTMWYSTNAAGTSWITSNWAMSDGAPTNYFGMRLEASSGPQVKQTIISDSFDRVNRVLDGTAPEASTVPGSIFKAHGSSGSAWQDVQISSDRVLLDSDVGLTARLGSTGTYVKPRLLNLSARVQLAQVADSGDEYARGIGVGFYSSEAPSPLGFTSARGLVLERTGRLTLVVDDGLDSGTSVAYDSALFDGNAFDPAAWHRVSYDVDTLTGDISNIQLDNRVIGDLTTAIFTDAATPFAGFWASSTEGFRVGYVDDFEVTAVPEPIAALLGPLIGWMLLRRARAA